MLATLLQAPKTSFSLLQQSCKPQKHFFFVATILQAPKSTFSSLQQSCKCQKPLFPRCNNLASTKKHFSLVATMLQAFPKALWPSCGFRRNSLLALFLHQTHVTKGLMRSRWGFCVWIRGGQEERSGFTLSHGYDSSPIGH